MRRVRVVVLVVVVVGEEEFVGVDVVVVDALSRPLVRIPAPPPPTDSVGSA